MTPTPIYEMSLPLLGHPDRLPQSLCDSVEAYLEKEDNDTDFMSQLDPDLQTAAIMVTNQPVGQAVLSSLQAAAAKTIVSSIHVGSSRPYKEFGHTNGEQLVRFAQSGRIVIFSIAKEILLSKGNLKEPIPPSHQQQQQQQPTQCTITDMPGEIILRIANFCELHDHVCIALSNKHLAKSISILHACPGGGLSIVVKWSPTTAVFKRQNLLKRISCHQSSPHLRFCEKCTMLLTTDPTFWRKQWEGLDPKYKMVLQEEICHLSVFASQTAAVHDDNLERIVLAWQDGIPALEGSTMVICPGCVPHGNIHPRGWAWRKNAKLEEPFPYTYMTGPRHAKE